MDYNMIGTAWSLLPPIVAIALALKTIDNDAIICIIVDFYISLQANNYL